ncbi:MAG: FAD-dependent oxidoreductase [Dermatophilaceae bacterium]|nr:FAD-dependent oxidoreductase [Intrasporangiaceae bacterium]
MHVAVVGGSDAGIEAARRCRELDPSVEVTVLVADGYPNLSICGLPYWHSREVLRWQDLAHRSVADLEATGMRLLLDHEVTDLDTNAGRLRFIQHSGGGVTGRLSFDRLVLGTGAHPVRPPIDGLADLGADDGVHVLHTMPDAFALDAAAERALEAAGGARGTVAIVGAGYVGVEMAEALTARGLSVVVLEHLQQVLARTLDPELASRVEAHLDSRGVQVRCSTTVRGIHRHDPVAGDHRSRRVRIDLDGESVTADLTLVATGVRPATELAVAAGLNLGAADAIAVDRQMRTSVEGVWAAGDCVHTHHQLTGEPTYLPLGTTAHKQGRVAGENVLGGSVEYAGSLGTQAVKIFDLVAAATGFRDTEARTAGFDPITIAFSADDHKGYYPGATELHIRLTGDRTTGRLLGGQLLGAYGAEVSKRVDILAAAIRHGDTVAGLGDLDLSYSPPLGAPWDALQQAAHAWTSQARAATSPSDLRRRAGAS